jgi:hypothetical protein
MADAQQAALQDRDGSGQALRLARPVRSPIALVIVESAGRRGGQVLGQLALRRAYAIGTARPGDC